LFVFLDETTNQQLENVVGKSVFNVR